MNFIASVLIGALCIHTDAIAQSRPPSVIPTSSAWAGECRLGAECRLIEPTFACSWADAVRLTEAGPDKGREVGLAAVRTAQCEIVPTGHPLVLEATTSPNAVYATDGGRHLGYLPVGVFAPRDQAATTACRVPGFCAVQPGSAIWICPQVGNFDLPSAEARHAAGCWQIGDGAAVEAAPAQGNFVALLNLAGGSPPSSKSYYAARSDLIGLDLSPTPTPVDRGWCRPGDWCVIGAGTLFCRDRAAYERILTVPVGEGRRAAILAEPACRVLIPGNVVKPRGFPAADDTSQLIEAEHPVLKAGWTTAKAFKVVAYGPPIRYTSRLADLVVSPAHCPSLRAIAMDAQGTPKASGVFRSGSAERQEFCRNTEREAGSSAFRACFSEPDVTTTVTANCDARRVVMNGRRFELRERPRDAAPDISNDPTRRWLFWDVAAAEWLDGSTASGETAVSMALDALCPGTNPEAQFGLVVRDATAAQNEARQNRPLNSPPQNNANVTSPGASPASPGVNSACPIALQSPSFAEAAARISQRIAAATNPIDVQASLSLLREALSLASFQAPENQPRSPEISVVGLDTVGRCWPALKGIMVDAAARQVTAATVLNRRPMEVVDRRQRLDTDRVIINRGGVPRPLASREADQAAEADYLRQSDRQRIEQDQLAEERRRRQVAQIEADAARADATEADRAKKIQETRDFGRNYGAASALAFYYKLYLGLDACVNRSWVFDRPDLQRFQAASSEFGKLLPQDTKDQIWSEVAAQVSNQPFTFQECVNLKTALRQFLPEAIAPAPAQRSPF